MPRANRSYHGVVTWGGSLTSGLAGTSPLPLRVCSLNLLAVILVVIVPGRIKGGPKFFFEVPVFRLRAEDAPSGDCGGGVSSPHKKGSVAGDAAFFKLVPKLNLGTRIDFISPAAWADWPGPAGSSPPGRSRRLRVCLPGRRHRQPGRSGRGRRN